ncbi:TasA family protein [Haloactinomyces albus]|uniref:SipW-cognate class signal peptide n=1 Tax=Haloactinomyces albus TaxID=1352928 RepID=A0AAE3ZA63_9ACTN|nr:TasA family protein [Haloactinomyces albus]MDR7301157.1 hypothetical protein [Haloactinomyces albus]
MKNKKLAAGIGGVTAVAAAVAISAGTFAAFSDSEERGVVATGGTMDLQVSNSHGDSVFGENGIVTIPNSVKPGDSYSATFTLRNEGDVNGDLSFKFVQMSNNENELTEPEEGAGDSTAGDAEGNGGGELLQNLELTAPTIDGATLAELAGDSRGAGALDADQERTFEVTLEVPQSATSVIQNDTASFKIVANLDQAQN